MDRRFEGWLSRYGARCSAVLLASAFFALTLGLVVSFAASTPPSFTGPKNYKTGLVPSSVAIGDLNGDGKRELTMANTGANVVSVFFNRRGGNFQRKLDYPTGRGPLSVAIGDLTGASSIRGTAASSPSATMRPAPARTKSRSAT